jgi:probable rRNA maturation factor
MRAMNRNYRGIDKITDVLSFSQLEDSSFQHGTTELGDIVICLSQARRQAGERGRTLNEELVVLIIHGLLHLIGYDHEKNRYQERIMKRKEMELYNAIQKVER